MRLYRRWWEQPSLDILEIRAGHAAEEGGGRLQGRKSWRLREREIRVGADNGEGMI